VEIGRFQISAAAPARQAPDQNELARLTSQAADYIYAGKADATLRAYRADWRHFENWCQAHGFRALPASPDVVALYLADFGGRQAAATLTRRLTSINKVHRAAGHPAPALMEHLPVGETLKGIRRTHGTEQHPKQPLFTAELRAMVAHLPDTLIGLRDRALLLIGFAGAFRRSELVNVHVEDVTETEEGLVIRVRRSKTDQEGKGRQVAIPYGSSPDTCPVRSWRRWIDAARLTGGPLFRRIDRHGHVNSRGLHRDSVGAIVKRAVEAAGLDPKLYAGHSLRAGLCTQAYVNGARELDIMRQTGHKSLETVRKYIRGRGLFRDNPAAKLGL
jgi:site-specific recombinase XerD